MTKKSRTGRYRPGPKKTGRNRPKSRPAAALRPAPAHGPRCHALQGKCQTGLTVAPYFIVINFHVSRFGLTVVPAACIVIGLHASPTVGCVKRVTTVITVLTPPSLTCGNQPNNGFNMAAVIAFQAIFDSCVPFWIFILTFTRSPYCLSF